MGLSSQTLRKSLRGMSIIEMLTVIGISSALLILLATLFKTGLFEASKSSGRIEMVRNGRSALDNVQRYLSSVMAPASIFQDDGAPLASTRAVFWPDDDMLHDPVSSPQPWQQRLQFFSPIDHLGGTAPLTARQLVLTPQNFAYEVVAVPGANPQSGQDLVLRRLIIPTPWPTMGVDVPPPLDAIDMAVQPRLIGRRLGIPDAAAPGGYRDALEVRRLQAGAFQIRINVTIETISDDVNRNRSLNATDTGTRNQTNTVTMQTVFQPAYFNIN